MSSSVIIRKAIESDEAALSKICLLTGDAGKSAAPQHDIPELPGLVYAVPYVKLPTTWGFVMEDKTTNEVVGYVLGSTDTREYERYAAENWWPALAEKYTEEKVKEKGDLAKEDDLRYVKLLKEMHTAPEANIRFSPAHLHIDILEEYQRKGWGRRLIDKATEYLKSEGFEAVWIGLDPRNDEARKFYFKLGFTPIGGDENQLGLRFFDFK